MSSAPRVLRQDLVDLILGMPVAAAFGLTFEELADGRAVARLRWRPEHSHVPGAFQANPIAALADFTGAGAAMSVLPPGGRAATVDYTAKFLAEARGDALVAHARVLRPGMTLTVSAVDVYVVAEGTEALCASALVTVRNFTVAHTPSTSKSA